jgi:hypothetical protein
MISLAWGVITSWDDLCARLCCSWKPRDYGFRTMTGDFQVPFGSLEQDIVKADSKMPQLLSSL